MMTMNIVQTMAHSFEYKHLTVQPELRQNEGLIDNQQSLMIGEWALRQLNGSAPLLQDYWLQESMEQIVWQLNAVARNEAPLGLLILNDQQINAFAIPAGLIGLNVGLIDKAKSIDELASVIAHEIAHISQRHYQHRNDEKSKHMIMQIAGIVAGVVISGGNSDAMMATMAGANSVVANQSASFSRSQEREADRLGMQIMAQAGYDVHAMPDFFTTLEQQNPTQSMYIPSFVLSHPLTTERLSEAKERARKYPTSQILKNDASILYRKQLFEQIQWRSRYLAKITNKNELRQNAKHSDGAKLALISLLIDENALTEANEVLQAFDKQIENYLNPLAVLTSAKLNEKQNKIQIAIEKLQNLANLLPERKDIQLYLADLYLKQQQPEYAQKVIRMLQPLTKQHPRNIVVWQKLQQASEILSKHGNNQDKKIQQINVLRYRAMVEFWQNQPESAMTSLNHAKTMSETVANNQAILATIHQQITQLKTANRFKP